MTVFLSNLIAFSMAATVVFSAPAEEPEEFVRQFHVTADQDDPTAIWRDLHPKNWQGWHPDAEIRITVKYGFLYKDDEISMKVADWEKFPDLWHDPEEATAMEDYVEQSHSARSRKTTPSGSGVSVITQRKVNYTWKAQPGQMLETDRFELVTEDGQFLIKSLHSTYDYR